MNTTTPATDQPVLTHIQALVNEEHRLYEHGEHGGLGETDSQKLAKVRVELDQCWDLLRQRRALRDVGGIQQWHNSAPGTWQRTMSSSQHGMEKRFQYLDLSVSHHTYIEASRSAMPCRTTPSRTSPLRP